MIERQTVPLRDDMSRKPDTDTGGEGDVPA